MRVRWQDNHPWEALLPSFDIVRPHAADLFSLEYFGAEPAKGRSGYTAVRTRQTLSPRYDVDLTL